MLELKISLPCIYAWCDTKVTHVTAGCFTLQGRCRICNFRGHKPEQCDLYDNDTKLRVFEYHADLGVDTRRRRELPEWGFHCLTFEPYYRHSSRVRSKLPLTYEELVSLPVPVGKRYGNYFNAHIRKSIGVIGRKPRHVVDGSPYELVL